MYLHLSIFTLQQVVLCEAQYRVVKSHNILADLGQR